MKITAIGYMTSPDWLQEVSRAAFVILGERFMLAVDRFSAPNKKAMHHIYEWNKIGYPAARLFVLNYVPLTSGAFVNEITFKESKVPVPIDPELLIPGKTGKIVTARNVFRRKAEVMELGLPVAFEAKKTLAFMTKAGMHFAGPGTRIVISTPGGKYTKNSLGSFMVGWYNKNAQVVMDSSGLYEKIANEAALILDRDNTSLEDVRAATFKIVDTIVAGRTVII